MRTRIVLGLDKCHGIRFLISGSFLKAKKKTIYVAKPIRQCMAMYGVIIKKKQFNLPVTRQ